MSDIRDENQKAFESILDAMVRLTFPDKDWSDYAAKTVWQEVFKQAFETPRNPTTIGNPHHNDPLDSENNP